jgi:hypothetical protein
MCLVSLETSEIRCLYFSLSSVKMCNLNGYGLTSSRHEGKQNSRELVVTKINGKLWLCSLFFRCEFQHDISMWTRKNGLDRYQLATFSWKCEFCTLIQNEHALNSRITSMIESRGNGKAIPLPAWSCPQGSRKLSFPDFLKTAQDGGKVVSLTRRPHLSSGNTPGTHFC